MAKKNFPSDSYKVGFFACAALSLALLFLLLNVFLMQSNNQQNREIALKFIDEEIENEDIGEFADKYFSQDIVLEFPPGFHFGEERTNYLAGKEKVKDAILHWQSYAEHNIDIIDAVAQDNMVFVLARQDRIFEGHTGIPAAEEHPMAYMFYFTDGKISKVSVLFDILDSVEAYKLGNS